MMAEACFWVSQPVVMTQTGIYGIFVLVVTLNVGQVVSGYSSSTDVAHSLEEHMYFNSTQSSLDWIWESAPTQNQ